jgi:hypothetical protein
MQIFGMASDAQHSTNNWQHDQENLAMQSDMFLVQLTTGVCESSIS